MPAEDTVEIEAGHGRTRNEGAARWVVSVGPKGRVDVATTEGKVGFQAKGDKVTVPAGHQSTALADAPPSEPKPIPPELLLSVFWPEPSPGGRPRGARQDPAVHARAGQWQDVPVSDDGRWSAPVPVPVGDPPGLGAGRGHRRPAQDGPVGDPPAAGGAGAGEREGRPVEALTAAVAARMAMAATMTMTAVP